MEEHGVGADEQGGGAGGTGSSTAQTSKAAARDAGLVPPAPQPRRRDLPVFWVNGGKREGKRRNRVWRVGPMSTSPNNFFLIF